VAFVYWGVSAFLEDDDIVHAVHYLYDWAAPGSCLVFNAQLADIPPSPEADRVMKIYQQMGTKVITRSLKQYHELLLPWKPDSRGFIPLLEWHGFDQSELGKEDVSSYGPMGGGYGAYCVK
jgi:hypothetical protein